MTTLLDTLRRREPVRSGSFQQWLDYFTFGGSTYPLPGFSQTLQGDRETIDGNFAGFVAGAYRGNGIVFACELARMSLFSEARFQFQELRDGRPGKLFSTPDLSVLDTPWQGAVTGDLLSRLMLDADLAGTGFAVRRRDERNRIRRARPDWLTIVFGSRSRDKSDALPLDAEIVGFLYHPGGRGSGSDAEILLPDEVAVFAPTPDPLANVRGMSWLTPVIREITSDSAATAFKQRFFEQGATPNLVVKLDKDIALQEFGDWIAKFKDKEPVGLEKAYRTLYLGAGADVTVVGGNLEAIDFRAVQGAGETRIAAAAGVPPVIAGFSEGLSGSSLNAGNYSSARRRFVDLTIRPAWRNISGSLQTIVVPPSITGGTARIWYDDRDIAFLREDAKDRSEILKEQMLTVEAGVRSGFTAKSVVAAVEAEDLSLLEHTGLFSVQLQPPGTGEPAAPAA